jgi:hypothetical protein
MMVKMLAGRAQRTGVYVLVSGADAERPSPAFGRGIRAAVEARIPVELLVLDFPPEAAASAAVAQTEIPADIPVRCFWRAEAPGGTAPRHSTAMLTPGPVPKRPCGGMWQTGYFRAGLPVFAVAESGGTTTIDHYGLGGVPLQRHEIDALGRLVRIIDLHPATGRDATHRYWNADGECWLSVWVDPDDGDLGPTQQYRPRPREFPSLRSAQAHWVVEQMARTTRPRVLTTGNAAEEVAKLVTRLAGVTRDAGG